MLTISLQAFLKPSNGDDPALEIRDERHGHVRIRATGFDGAAARSGGQERRDLRPVLLRLRAGAARSDEPDRLPRGLPRQSGHDRERGGAHDRRHRRTGHRRHRQGPAPRPHLPQSHHQALSDARRLFRHGRDDSARRQLFPACGAGSRGTQADPLSPGPGRGRQVVAGRAPQGADGDPADLRARRRRRDQPGVRIAARSLPPGDDGRRPRKPLRRSLAASDRNLLALGGQAARRLRRRPLPLLGRQALSFEAATDRRRQDRAGRREQPGHLDPRRQGRHPQARTFLAARSGRLQLRRRPQPHDAGPAGIRRDVQGADQGAAPAA